MKGITNEQSEYLLNLPKKIVGDTGLLDSISINHVFPINQRFELLSEQDSEFAFLWEIQQSKKNTIRVSLHCQEHESKIGLVRVDYNGGHINPVVVTDLVPVKFHPYAGKVFSNTEHHIHYHVQGYKSLSWAIPLSADQFGVKQLNAGADFNNTLTNAVLMFARLINIETTITINSL